MRKHNARQNLFTRIALQLAKARCTVSTGAIATKRLQQQVLVHSLAVLHRNTRGLAATSQSSPETALWVFVLNNQNSNEHHEAWFEVFWRTVSGPSLSSREARRTCPSRSSPRSPLRRQQGTALLGVHRLSGPDRHRNWSCHQTQGC